MTTAAAFRKFIFSDKNSTRTMLGTLSRNHTRVGALLFLPHRASIVRDLTSCLFAARKSKKSIPHRLSPILTAKSFAVAFTASRNSDSLAWRRNYTSTPNSQDNKEATSSTTTNNTSNVNNNNDNIATSGVVAKKSWWFGTKERFKQKKAQFLLEYGSTFIFIHEILGITSYVVVFSLLSWGVIPVESILNFFGWTETDLAKYNIDLHGKFTTGALTYVVVKGLDAMGLVPLRWFLTFTLTPRVAWFIGPKIDRAVAAVKRLFGRKSKTPIK